MGLLGGAEFFPPHHQLHLLGLASYAFCNLHKIRGEAGWRCPPQGDQNDTTAQGQLHFRKRMSHRKLPDLEVFLLLKEGHLSGVHWVWMWVAGGDTLTLPGLKSPPGRAGSWQLLLLFPGL